MSKIVNLKDGKQNIKAAIIGECDFCYNGRKVYKSQLETGVYRDIIKNKTNENYKIYQ